MMKQMIRGAAACAMVAGLALSSADAQIFQREIGDETPEWAYSVDTTMDGGSITAGYRRVPDRSFEFHIVKYKADGTTEWEVTFGGDREDIAYSVQQTSDGGYIVAGESRSFEAGFEIVLLRLDASGNQVWANSYPGSFMVDPIHSPHPGVALDQGLEDEIYVVGRLANTAGDSRPIAFRTDAGGLLEWHASYVAPPSTGDIAELAFTDVGYSFVDRSIVISGTIRDEGPIFPDDPTGLFTTRQDAVLLKVNADPDDAAGIPGGVPRWFNRYDSLFDRDSPNEPNVWETGDGLDIFNQGQIVLAGRTDLGIGGPGGSFRATYLVHTDMMGFPFWSRDYETFTADGLAATVDTAYAAVEFDRRVDAFVQTGQVVAGGPTSVHTQLTAVGGAPIWSWQYGGSFRSFGESVQPDLEGCGYVLAGTLFNPAPPPGQGASDIYLIENNDAGETGCLERELFVEPVAPLQPRPLQIFPNFQDGQSELPDLTQFVDSPNTPFCLSDDCDVAPDPCNDADIVPPFGVLDLDDVNAFILAYTLMLPPADIAPPFGVWDLSDINAFITAFLSGCP